MATSRPNINAEELRKQNLIQPTQMNVGMGNRTPAPVRSTGTPNLTYSYQQPTSTQTQFTAQPQVQAPQPAYKPISTAMNQNSYTPSTTPSTTPTQTTPKPVNPLVDYNALNMQARNFNTGNKDLLQSAYNRTGMGGQQIQTRFDIAPINQNEVEARRILASTSGWANQTGERQANPDWLALMAKDPEAGRRAFTLWEGKIPEGGQSAPTPTVEQPAPAPLTAPAPATGGLNLPGVDLAPERPVPLNWYDQNQRIDDTTALETQRLKDLALKLGVPSDLVLNMNTPEDAQKYIDMYSKPMDIELKNIELQAAKGRQRIAETGASVEQQLGQDREWNFANANIMANQNAQGALSRDLDILNNDVQKQQLQIENAKKELQLKAVGMSQSSREAAAERINSMEQKLYNDKLRLIQGQNEARDQALKLAQFEQGRQETAFNQQYKLMQMQREEQKAITDNIQNRVETIKNLSGMGYDIGFDPNEYILKGVLKELPQGQTIDLGKYKATATSKPEWKQITNPDGTSMLVNTDSYDPKLGTFTQTVNAGVSSQYFKNANGQYSLSSSGTGGQPIYESNISKLISLPSTKGNREAFLNGYKEVAGNKEAEIDYINNYVVNSILKGQTKATYEVVSTVDTNIESAISTLERLRAKGYNFSGGAMERGSKWISTNIFGNNTGDYNDFVQARELLVAENRNRLFGASLTANESASAGDAMGAKTDSIEALISKGKKVYQVQQQIKDRILKQSGGIPIYSENINAQTEPQTQAPNYQDVYNSVKASNPNATDEQIKQYYQKKHGQSFNQTESVSKLPTPLKGFVAEAGTTWNNPSGLKVTPKKVSLLSQILKAGEDFFEGGKPTDSTGGKYFAFKDIDTAMKAYKHIFKTNLANMDVYSALGNWVGTSEAPSYAKTVLKTAGISPNTKVSQLDEKTLDTLIKAQLKKENINVYNKKYA